MTKHLRFLIVLLMTLVWSTGGAQTTIWSEDWTGGQANQTPSSFNRAIYTQSSNVSIQTGSPSAGGNAPELMIKKNSSWTVKITDLKSCKGDVTLTLKTNYIGRLSVSVGSSTINLSAVEGQTKTFSGTFNVNELAVPFNIVFKNKNNSQNLRIDDIVLTGTSLEETKKTTNVSFGANTGKTFTFTEGEYTDDGTFTAPTATETTGVEGTIVYSSNNESAVSVNASTGELSFPGYGEATITATFTPTDAKTYAVSTDSYKVKNERGVVAGTITFDKANGAFENVDGSGYNSSDYTFVSDSKESFTFKCTNVLKQNEFLQLQATKGKVESPTFPQFTNGYKVYVVYSSEQPLTLQAGDHNAIGTTTDSGSSGTGAAVSIEVSANGSFVINVGSKYAKISKIEIIPNKIDETETTTLDETATNNNIVAKTGVNVTLMRTMKADMWNTICLPFDVSAEKAKIAFGEGVKIAELDGNSTGTTLSFKNVDAIKATIPYLIKPTIAAPAEGYKFEGVTIKDDGKGNVAPGAVMTEGLYGFVGVYNPVDATEDIKNTVFNSDCYAAFLGANNTIFKAAGGTMKGFRAYFAIPNGTSASALRVVIDGTATSIKSINSEVVESNAPVYNLQGQRVDGNNLTPGIYVKAGKKFVVK
ncbi:MAG: hypothetical protein MR933_01775 [Prevotella sp.]|uniref:hypothetical protein n=1 Tax=Prevotella sp. TaxID=59823 RepID=UPI0025E85450|nr:hypothetical protein [Prevotella sp.]MCI7118516.1 hypothetical protein [Prevotella sp.]